MSSSTQSASSVANAARRGSPLSGFILKAFEGVEGLHNWQWLFVVEAIPSFLLAFVVLRYLDNDVKSARWLSDEEKQVVSDDLEIDRQRSLKANGGSHHFKADHHDAQVEAFVKTFEQHPAVERAAKRMRVLVKLCACLVGRRQELLTLEGKTAV